jgi:hypothetical protein
VPAYAYPDSAARALGHAVRYQAWRVRQQGRVPELPGVRAADGRALVSAFLDGTPGGGWLPDASAVGRLSGEANTVGRLSGEANTAGRLSGEVNTASLLACYEIPLAGSAAWPGGGRPAGDGVEVLAGVVQEPVFGPLVVFGLGGAAPAILGARAARLSPLTDADAAEMIRGVSGAELLFGPPAGPAVDVAALAGLLLRVSRLADDLPEVAELNLSPVIASPGGVSVLAARIRVSPVEPRDPFLRRLR